MGKEPTSKRRRPQRDEPPSEDEITPAPPRRQTNGRKLTNGKPKSTRRRVKFVDAPPSPPAPEPARAPVRTTTADDDTPLADMTGADAPSHSLMTEGAGVGVTAFDIAEELDDGAHDAANDDGVIPDALRRVVNTEADEAADYSTDDDAPPPAESVTPRAEEDAWADSMETAPPAAAQPEPPVPARSPKRPRYPASEAGTTTTTILSRASAVSTLASLLHDGESGAQAIVRLQRSQNPAGLEAVTEACHALLGHGLFSAYDLARDEVLAAVRWDLQWGRAPGAGRKTHGPVEAGVMRKWERARYFRQKGKRAWVRPTGASHVEWRGAGDVFGERPPSA